MCLPAVGTSLVGVESELLAVRHVCEYAALEIVGEEESALDRVLWAQAFIREVPEASRHGLQ